MSNQRMRARAFLFAIVAVVTQTTSDLWSQERPLTVQSASPSGEVTQTVDANEIRIVFSEPMVGLGGPVTTAPDWLSVQPAMRANYYWSGTRTLIVSVDPDAPLPLATRFVVRVAGSARSAAGRAIASPYTFNFTTPTIRLFGAEWYRKDGRFDGQAVIALRFNQPVRPADLLPHLTVSYTPHEWTRPQLSGRARERLRRESPEGLEAFDAKVERAARIAASSAAVPVALAADWDERRFPRTPEVIVIETVAAPATDGWLRIATDSQLPSPAGSVTGPAQQTTVRLEPTFFIADASCTASCAPGTTTVGFRRGVQVQDAARAVAVYEAMQGSSDRAIQPGEIPSPPSFGPAGTTRITLASLGLPNQPPASTWITRIDARLTATDGQVLGYPWLEIVDNLHASPYAQWGGWVWEAANGPVVPVMMRNVTRVQAAMETVPVTGVLARLLELRQGAGRMFSIQAPTDRLLRIAPDVLEAQGVDLRSVLNGNGHGLVWSSLAPVEALEGSAMPQQWNSPRRALLQVTNLGITVKDSPRSTLVAVTRLDNAAPVAAAHVSIVDANGAPLWSGTTGTDGVAMAPVLSLRRPQQTWQFSYIVTAAKDGDVAWVGSDWAGDVAPSSFGLSYQLDETPEVLQGSIFTERGVYARAEEVKFKGIFRRDGAAGMRPLADGARLTVVTHDARGREIDREAVTVNRWSAADWSVSVPADAALGYARVTAFLGDAPGNEEFYRARSITTQFLVAAFRRPDFRVDTTVTAAPAIMGTSIAATAQATYLFGASIGPQPVRWFATRTAILSLPPAVREKFDERQYVFGYLPSSPESRFSRVMEKNERLDTDGRLRAEVPTETGADFASTYRFEADVPSASGQRIAHRSEIVMHPASFYIGLGRPRYFVDLKEGLNVPVIAAGLDGTTRPNVAVTLSLWREQWTAERRRENPGSINWTRQEVAAGEWPVTTADAAVRRAIALKEGGCFILRAVATDEAGRPTRTETRFYVLGGGHSMWRTNGNRIELTPERTTWKPGETARILVQSPWERATALVTKEREGVSSYHRVNITSMQDTIEVPISESDIPNAFVSVVLFKGRTEDAPTDLDPDPGKPAFRVGYVELTVDDAAKRLKVDVTADRQEYRPRQQVNVSLSVSDATGRPRAGEVTLWAVDHGLLSLTEYRTPDVARAIYARKAIQVQTQDTRSRLIGKRSIVNEPIGPQGGGGGGRGGGAGFAQGGQAFRMSESVSVEAASELVLTQSAAISAPGVPQPDIEVRKDFRPVVFWIGSVATGADGRASTSVTLPDSLTTYRIMAVAGDLESHFGAGDTEIRASKPLTLLPSFPRFLMRGDQASFGAIVTNNTTRPGDAVVTIRSLNAAALALSETTQTLRLAAGESRNVRFGATARASGSAPVRISVTLGAETDAFELALPVSAPLQLETVAAYGDTTTSATEKLSVPAGVATDRGGLTVSLASTALVGLGESARYLQDYPYECAEQKASKALALLLSADLGGTFGASVAKPEQLRADGTRLLSDLTGYQCPDGGFSLFPGQCYGQSSIYLTAYVLDVMRRAGALGVSVPSSTVQQGLDFLMYQSQPQPPEGQWWPAWAASNAYAQKVLAEGGRNRTQEINRLYAVVDRMPVFALSYLADALAASGDRGYRYADVTRRITNALRVDADRAHVEEVDDAALVWLWNTNVRATAVVLDGISRRKDDGTFVSPLVRWLLAARENGRWSTTQENVVALSALVNYYKTFESETPNMNASVSIAGERVGTATFAGRSTTAEQVRIAMPELLKQVTTSPRDLQVSRTGTGRLFYTARLQYATLVPQTSVVDRGIRIERRYQKVTADGPQAAATTFSDGDLVRVTLTVSLPHEGRFLAFTDPLPAGFEAVDGTLKTTASDLAAVSTTQSSGQDGWAWWRRGGFDHVEKHDDKVLAFATRLTAGRHEFTYLARATTAGTFNAPGATGEAMYAPEITGRSAAATVTIK